MKVNTGLPDTAESGSVGADFAAVIADRHAVRVVVFVQRSAGLELFFRDVAPAVKACHGFVPCSLPLSLRYVYQP